MKVWNLFTLFVILTLLFPVIANAQEKPETLPLPLPVSSDDDFVCGLRKDVLFIEVTVIDENSLITNLNVEDFEIYYENKKQEIISLKLGEILAKSDVMNDEELLKDSDAHYLIGIRLDFFPFDEKFRKNDIKVNISKEKRLKLRKLKIEIRNFLYQ